MSTFASFSTVRLGIYCAQKGLEVTGNNITNINTPGYTRQRLDQISLVVNPADRTASQYNANIGQGAFVTSVSQARDFSLDITYRNALSDLGESSGKLTGLNDLATILDEVGKGGATDGQDDGVLLAELNNLRDLISQAAANGIDEYDGLIRTAASALTRKFNSIAKSLETLQTKYETQFNDQKDTVNSLLERIQELNLSIRNCDLRGDNGLELRDQRNQLLDELSQYVSIDVTYTTDKVGASVEVEHLTVKLAGSDATLVDGLYAAQLEETTPKPNPGDYKDGIEDQDYKDAMTRYERRMLTVTSLKDLDGNLQDPNLNGTGIRLGDNDLHGALQATRELITENGEYSTQFVVDNIDDEANLKRGIPYYQNALDHLAREFAEEMNSLNQVAGVEGAGNLFSTSSGNDTGDGITAANISVSKSWSDGTVWMQAKGSADAPSGDVSNLNKFLAKFDETITFDPKDMVGNVVTGAAPFEGTFEDMLLHFQSVLGEDQMGTQLVTENYAYTADEIYVNRDSVMGVDLNDEATSLMVYQKAYTSACRLLTVIDEALETLINTAV